MAPDALTEVSGRGRLRLAPPSSDDPAGAGSGDHAPHTPPSSDARHRTGRPCCRWRACRGERTAAAC